MLDVKTKILIPEVKGEWTDRVHQGKMLAVWNGYSKNDLPIVKLVPPQEGLKSELIDGAWYWVVGCDICLGDLDKHNYHCCYEHNRCVDCQTHREDLTEHPWGAKGGFKCKPCAEKEADIERTEALERVASKEYDPWDYQNEDKVICPHCASSYEPDHEDSTEDKSCEVCGGIYSIEVDYSVSYSTAVVGERVTLCSDKGEKDNCDD